MKIPVQYRTIQKILGVSTLVALGLIFNTGCNSTAHQPSAPASQTATAAAAQMDASQVAEISFDKGSAVLSESARQSLVKMVNQARSTGLKIDDVRVAAWADREYPTQARDKLPKAERDLADRRARAVSDFLKSSLNVSDVDTYNMAVG